MQDYVFSDGLERKVTNALLLIRKAYRYAKHRGERLEVAVSGGKDSDVLVALCRMADVWGTETLRPLHKITTIDPPYTLAHVKAIGGVELVRPRKTFAQCILSNGIPNMFRRHCCDEIKEYAIERHALIGVRRCESARRKKRYVEMTQCVSMKRGGTVQHYYPLLEWTDDDVAEFVNVTKTKCHPLYYDEKGVFHVERRLGCMCCPLMYRKKRVSEFKKYPKMLRFYCRYGKQYLESHKDAKVAKAFNNVYEWILCDLFFKDYNSFKESTQRLDGEPLDAKVFLERHFGVNLDF